MNHPEPPPDLPHFFQYRPGEGWFFIYRTPGHGTGIWAEPGCVHHVLLADLSGDRLEMARGIAVTHWLRKQKVFHKVYRRARYATLPRQQHLKDPDVLRLKHDAKWAERNVAAWLLWRTEQEREEQHVKNNRLRRR